MTAGSLPGALAGLVRTPVPPGAQEATVTALRVDGRVNASDSWDGRLLGIPALDTYRDRAVGDRVLIADVSGVLHVIGRVGHDPDAPAPAVAPATAGVFTPDGTPGAGSGRMQQGMDGGPGEPLLTGWFYGTGLSTAASTASTVRVWMARDPILHGAYGPQTLRLFLHASTTPSTSGFAELGAYQPVSVLLEVGEVRIVTLPEEWRAALAAGTAYGIGAGDVSGMRIDFIRLVEPSGGYTTT